MQNGNARFVFRSPYSPTGSHPEFDKHHAMHGDGVKDVAFTVDDAAGIYKKAVDRGAKGVQEPTVMKDDDGEVIIATVQTYGDTTHTFVQRAGYKGLFLPEYKAHHLKEKFNESQSPIDLICIDHCVGN